MSSLFASSARRGRKGEQGAPGSAISGGRVFYLSNDGGSPPDYEGLSFFPDANPEEAMTATGITSLDGEVLLQSSAAPSVWITEPEVPGISVIDAGVWTVKLFAAATSGDGSSKIRFKLYKATADLLTETLLFTWSDSAALPTVSSSAIDVEDVVGTLSIEATDRLILRAYAITASTTPVDVSLYHSGTSRYTRINSPIVVATVYSDLTPLSGGTAHPGVQNVASRGDHRHAHGIIAGGNTHALAIANGAAGYISGADKAKVDSITVANLTSADEKAALVGTSGTAPSGSNKFVDDADSRLTNSRSPNTHASSHVTGGSDVINNAVANGNAGLMSGADKAKLDGVEALADVTTFTKVNTVLGAANANVSINGQKITNLGPPSASTDADTLGARDTAITAAFNVSEAVSGASPATTAQVIVDVVFSFRVVSNAVVEIASYDMLPGTSVAIRADVQAFTEATHANQLVHVIVGSGKRTSAGTSSRTSAAGGGGSGQVVNDFAVTRPALSVSDPSSAVSPNVQHRLALLYTGKSGVNTIVMGTARILIGKLT